MTLSNLTAYQNILENSAATPGLFDRRFTNAYNNAVAIDATISAVSSAQSAFGSGVSGLRDVTIAKFGGALGDGTTDDRSAFSTGATSTQTQAVLYAPSSASVFKIGSALTILGTYQPIRGAVLRPASGITIYHRGAIQAGPYQVWDLSLGGAIDFTGNREIHYFDPRWFGVIGDNVADDTAAWQSIFSYVPSKSWIRIPSGMEMRISSTIRKWGKDGLRLTGHRGDAVANDNSAKFLWYGPSGGTMFEYARSEWGITENISFIANPLGSDGSGAACVFDINMRNAAGSNIESLERFEKLRIAGSYRSDFIGFAIAQHTSDTTNFNDASNCEYLQFWDCQVVGVSRTRWYGYPGLLNNSAVTCSLSASSDIVRLSKSTDDSGVSVIRDSDVTKLARIRLPSAGPAGALLDTWIIGRGTSGLTFQIASIASSQITGRAFLVDTNVGIGLGIGGSFNAKGIKIRDCEFKNSQAGIWSHGGSIRGWNNSYTDNEYNLIFDGDQSEPSVDLCCNTEESRSHVSHNGSFPFDYSGGRISAALVVPDQAMVMGNASQLIGDAVSWDDPNNSAVSGRLFSGIGYLSARNDRSGGFTYAQTGLDSIGNGLADIRGWRDSIGTGFSADVHEYGSILRYLEGTTFIGGSVGQASTSQLTTANLQIQFYGHESGGDHHDIRGQLSVSAGGLSSETRFNVCKILKGFTSWTPGGIGPGSLVSTSVSIPGAARGNFAGAPSTVQCGLQADLQDCVIRGAIGPNSASAVTVYLKNESASTVTFAATQVSAWVWFY